MLLSICMIVKNEEKYIRRCLEGLKPVLNQLDSELIIADTGSTDNTFAIAQEYTKNIFHVEWQGDFAAARNETLKRSKGAWLMTVDADEIFEDVSPLLSFFRSGEYKKYNSATFVQRNYADKNLKNYTDFNAPRLTALKTNTHYFGIVHERLTTFAAPVKILLLIAHHYGYITFDNKEYVEKKTKKYLALLFTQLEKDPNDYFCLFNIAQAYMFNSEYEKALKYCEDCFNVAKIQHQGFLYAVFYTKAALYQQMGRIDKTLETIQDYFSFKPGNDPARATDLELYFLKADCCFRQKDYCQAIASIREYIMLYNEYLNGKLRTSDTLQHSINFVNDSSFQHGIYILLESYIGNEDYKKALSETVIFFSTLSGLNEKAPGLGELYEKADEKYREMLRNFLELLVEHSEVRADILRDFSDYSHTDSDYSQLMKLRGLYDDDAISINAVSQFFERVEAITPEYADAVYYALKLNMPIETLTSKMDAYDLESCLFISKYLHYKDLPEVISRYNGDSTDACAVLFKSFLFRWLLNSESLSDDEQEKAFYIYSESIYSYLSKVFKAEILTDENSSCVPKPFRSGLYCYLALDELKGKHTALGLKHLKTALSFDNGLKKVILVLHDKLQKEADEASAKAAQFAQYAKSVKASILALINSGNKEKASMFLTAYRELCPDDPDVSQIQSLLNQ